MGESDAQKEIWDERFTSGNPFIYDVEWLGDCLDHAGVQKGARVLDLGCGDGAYTKYLANQGFDVWAADISEVAVSRIVQLGCNAKPDRFDMSQGIPYDASSFDVVLSNLSSHYFARELTSRVYQDVWRILKPGGIFIVRVNDEREYRANKAQDTVEVLEPLYVRSKNGKLKRYFTKDGLLEALDCFDVLWVQEVDFSCCGATKYALEAAARKTVGGGPRVSES